MSSSKRVAQNFSRHAITYSEEAHFQQYVAEKLLQEVQQISYDRDVPITILELGCGTGFVTQKLLQLFPNAVFDVCDISQEMLTLCKENCSPYAPSATLNFHKMDINTQLPKNKYDLICSSLSFQWIDDLEGLLIRLKELLYPKGNLIFSTLLNKTFKPLQDAFAYHNVPYPGPRFLSEETLQTILKDIFPTHTITFSVELKGVEFETPLQFLKQIQSIGTTSGSETPVNISKMRSILNYLSEQYKGKRFSVSYHLALININLERT